MSEHPLIEIRNLTRVAMSSGRLLLDQVNLKILGGRRIGLVGPSGSGKSSLLRAIAKLDPCDSGDVVFRGQVIAGDGIPPYRRSVVYLSQRPAFCRGSVRENLQLPFTFKSANESYDDSRARRLLERLFENQSIMDQPIDSLSGGEQQIIALIRSLLLSPQVLLLDEPTASLDAEARSRFERVVDDWYCGKSDCPRSLIWTSHDVDQIHRVTCHVIEIEHGRIITGVA